MRLRAICHSARLQGFEPEQLLDVASDSRLEHHFGCRAARRCERNGLARIPLEELPRRADRDRQTWQQR